MSRLAVPRMLTAGSLVTSVTAIRVGATWIGLLAERTPPLVRLGLAASFGGQDIGKAQAAFRDDLIAFARESTERSWRELRRGVDELDAFTRDGPEPGTGPQRPHRVKR